MILPVRGATADASKHTSDNQRVDVKEKIFLKISRFDKV